MGWYDRFSANKAAISDVTEVRQRDREERQFLLRRLSEAEQRANLAHADLLHERAATTRLRLEVDQLTRALRNHDLTDPQAHDYAEAGAHNLTARQLRRP